MPEKKEESKEIKKEEGEEEGKEEIFFFEEVPSPFSVTSILLSPAFPTQLLLFPLLAGQLTQKRRVFFF